MWPLSLVAQVSTMGNLHLAVVGHLMCFGWMTFPTFNVYFYVFYTSFVTVGVIHCKVVSLGYPGALVHVAFTTPCPGFNHGKSAPGGGRSSRSPPPVHYHHQGNLCVCYKVTYRWYICMYIGLASVLLDS